MKKILLGTAVLGGLFMASCTEDIYDENRVKEDYTQNFIEQFGPINENQDWNMAAQKSVTVNPGEASEVQIYAKSGDVYKLVGHYQNVSGTQTLTFDAAKGVDDFVITAGGQGKLVKNGETVSFEGASTRGYISGDRENVFERRNDYEYFGWDEALSFAKRLTDGEDNRKIGITTNFSLIAEENEEVTVYPIYWHADNNHILGMYWYEDGYLKKQDIYRDKNGDVVQINVTETEREWVQDGHWPWDGHWENKTVTKWIDATENLSTEAPERGQTVNEDAGIRSKGFTIKLPAGTEYGFYIKSFLGNNNRNAPEFYSKAELNNDEQPCTSFLRQTTDEGAERTFLGFEDSRNNSDYDLNDFMLIIDPSPLVIDYDTEEWIIAAEDLGATDDYDFNDVVFSVAHVTGSETATITPLAAGGSKATYLYRDGTQIGGGEFHTLLGGSVNENGSYAFVNTESAGPKGSPFTINVPVDFSLAYGDDTNMGKFSLQVDGVDTSIEAPGKGTAPQMICVPAGWKWPVERTNISVAYPDFGSWGANYQNSEWYKTPVDGKVLGNSN